MRILLYTDGGARGNPGPAGIGVIVDAEDGRRVVEWKEYIGETTNNVAEYRALIKGLELAHQHGATDVCCNLDSELVVKQLNREYKVKDKDLQALFMKAWNIAATFASCTYHHIPRERNSGADALVNAALDARFKN